MARLRRVFITSLQFEKNFVHRFCSKIESLELPGWFKFSNGDQSNCLDLDDDFVLPTQIESSEQKITSSKIEHHHAIVKITTRETADSDVDEVTKVMKHNFISPGEVVKSLGNCSFNVSTELVNRILKRFSNDWIPAFGFFLWSDARVGFKHSSESYDTMVDILGKFKQFDLMWALVEEMKQAEGLVSLVTMTKIMRRLAGAGRWIGSINTFRALEKFGVRKDTTSMNVLLDSLCKERSVKRARDAFLEFKSEISPNATTFNVLIHGYCKARKLKDALNTMVEMREFGFVPCVITYTSLVEAYCLEKNFERVYAILDEMHIKGCSPNIVTYTIVMHSLGKAREIEKALEIFEKVKRDGSVLDTSFYNSLIYLLCKGGQLQDANDVYEEMRKTGFTPNVTTYNTLISSFCHKFQEKKALELLLKMEEDSCEPDIKTYAPLMKMCCRKQWTKILMYMLGHMVKKDISPDFGTYILLINGLSQNRKLRQSCLFFEEMVLKGFRPKHNTYNKLLEALEREKMDDAKKKIQQLIMNVITN